MSALQNLVRSQSTAEREIARKLGLSVKTVRITHKKKRTKLIDRLVHHAEVINITGESYRVSRKRKSR